VSAAVLALPGAGPLAERIAARLEAHSTPVEVHRFPDGEHRVRLAGGVSGRPVVLAAALERPDDKLLPLLFAAATARDLGAASVGLAAPYLPYMRQDRSFKVGQATSARYFAQLLSRAVDWLVTVDPHLHRIPDPARIFSIPVEVVHAAPLLAAWVHANVAHPLLLGPDAESAQWVEAIASAAGAPYAVFRKRRLGDVRVALEMPDLSAHAGRTPVLADDIVASGVTMARAVRLLRAEGWPSPVCLGVHAVFAPGAWERLVRAGAAGTATCNTIAHPSNAIDVHSLVADAAAGVLEGSRATAGAQRAV
jgi:ribose-phosphate pyrophosphokinase